MPALSVFLDDVLRARVRTELFQMVTLGLMAINAGEPVAVIDFGGVFLDEEGERHGVFSLKKERVAPGQRVRLEFTADGMATNPGETLSVSSSRPSERPLPTAQGQGHHASQTRPSAGPRERLTVAMRTSTGRTVTEDVPAPDVALVADFYWHASAGHRVSASLQSYRTDRIEVSEPRPLLFGEQLSVGQWIEIAVDAAPSLEPARSSEAPGPPEAR